MSRKSIVNTLYVFLFLLLPTSGMAMESTENGSFLTRFQNQIVQTWNSSNYDLYLPLYTWHNRFAYSKDRVRKYNETPWGIGIGKSRHDNDGDWHALYAMGFQDSNNMYQPMIGYAYLKNWHYGATRDLRLGVGYTLGITARQEYNYIPLPLPLPIFGIEYKRLSLQGAYVPGGRNDGNVLFCWLRWQLN